MENKKKDNTSDQKYNTHLASEYLMMSILARAGIDAYLSLGNKKEIDIVIPDNLRKGYKIIEVKGVNLGSNDWIVGNKTTFIHHENLYYALFSFNGKIKELGNSPDFWLIPSEVIEKDQRYKIAKNKKTVFLSHKIIKESYGEYFNKLDALWKANKNQ